MAFDGSNQELADRLSGEKEEVSKLGFALGLLVHDSYTTDNMVHRINAWIDVACEALRKEAR